MKLSRRVLQIPFRVVVDEILSYMEIVVMKTKPPYGLYGYFSNDRTRKIFFLFQSFLTSKFPPYLFFSQKSIVFFDETRIRNLSIRNVGLSGERYLTKNHSRMRNIESLTLLFYQREANREQSTNLSDFFQNDKIFPSLKRFEVQLFDLTQKNYFDCTRWGEATSFWNRIESLRFQVSRQQSVKNNEIPMIFGKNLRKLRIFMENEVQLLVLNLPKIKSLVINGVKNLEINAGLDLENVTIDQPDAIRNLYTRYNSKIKELHVSSRENVEWIFYHENFQKIEDLIIQQAIFTTNICSGQNLKKLELRVVKDLNDSALDVSFPNLEEFVMIQPIDVNEEVSLNRKYEWTKNVKRITLINVNLSDNFFILNDFTNLKELRVLLLESCKFPQNPNTKWSDFPSLEWIFFRDITIPDSIFEINDFRNVKKLEIMQCPGLKTLGNSLDYGKIEYMSYNGKDIDIDRIMSTKSFDSLRTIKILRNEFFGKGWKELKELTSMFLCLCPNVNDSLFQEQNFKKLEDLHLGRSKNINGEKWNFLPKLERISVNKCGGKKNGFFVSEYPFGENTVVNTSRNGE